MCNMRGCKDSPTNDMNTKVMNCEESVFFYLHLTISHSASKLAQQAASLTHLTGSPKLLF